MNGLSRLLLQSGPMRVIVALGLTGLIATIVFAFVFHMGGEDKALLFSGVDVKDAGAITAKLDQAQIAYELRGDGSSIYVPRSKVLSARMMLEQDGLPARGSVGYEIFDKPDALGQTQFMQNISQLRALEGELARSIASLNGVAAARVHLVLPQRQLFERQAEQPSASIVLKLTRDALSPGEVRAIRNLVASATPGLSAQRVTILDETGALLAAAHETGPDGSPAADDGLDERQVAVEDRIRKTVQDIVEGVVGPGAARVQVTADLDLNQVTQKSETFDPESKVVRSTQTTEESSTAQESSQSGGVSASNNTPGGAPGAGGGAGPKNAATKSQETVNYEISKTTKTEVIEGGAIKKLSVAVAVDGVSTPAAKAGDQPKWAPRSADEMAHLTALVRSAVGYDETRGDKVEVVNVRFARPAIEGTEAAKPSMFSFQSGDLMRALEVGGSLIAALAVVFFVLGPLARGLLVPGAGAADPLLGAPAGAPGSAGAAIGAPPLAAALPGPAGSEPEPLIDVARIHGQVRASSVKKVAEVVEEHPDESVSILRGWLNNAV